MAGRIRLISPALARTASRRERRRFQPLQVEGRAPVLVDADVSRRCGARLAANCRGELRLAGKADSAMTARDRAITDADAVAAQPLQLPLRDVRHLEGTDAQEISAGRAGAARRRYRALGVEWVVFTGGEPLMHSDLFRLSAMLRARGIRVTMLSTRPAARAVRRGDCRGAWTT